MSIQLPSQPWQEGDTFTNDATGVEYTFDGVKWLASGGEELDLSHFEDRLHDIEAVLPSNAPQPVNIGDQTLKVTGSRPVGAAGEAGVMQVWKSQIGGPGNPFNEAKFICPDKDAIDLNASELWLKQGSTIQRWDTAGGGWWTNSNVFHVSATATEGDALIDGQPVELYYSDPGLFYLEVISRDESKADDQLLQDQIDSHVHSTYFLIGDWSDSEFKPHADLRALDESYMDLYDVTQKAQKLVDTQQNKRLDALEESAPSGNGLGRRFKYTDSREPDDGFFFVNANDATFSFTDLNGVVRKMTNGPDFSWNYGYRMTVWGMDGELWLAAEMRTGSNYSSTHLRLYVGTVKYDRGLVSGEEYDVIVEGYW